MSTCDHPLCAVFSRCDLARLKSGQCVESEGAADDTVVRILTEDNGGPNYYAVWLGKWFRQAARHGDEIRSQYRAQLRGAASDRTSFLQVASELMAAYFLEVQQGFDLRYIPRQKVRTPDFQIHRDGLSLVVEVKTIVGDPPPPDGVRPVMPVASAAPLLRQAMKAARGQLDGSANNLVLVINYYDREILEHEAVDAAYGDLHLATPLGADGPMGGPYEVRDENVFFQPGKNTRIGAMGILWYTRHAGSAGYFIHNGHALNRIPEWAFDPWAQFVVDEAKGVMVWRNRPGER